MIDWWRIEGFDWDDGNDRKSADKHGVSRSEAEQVFFNDPLLIVRDTRHSASEVRFHALGQTDARRPLHITFTLRRGETMIRVISAPTMHRRERLRYDQED
jgi:uncharacterized protein